MIFVFKFDGALFNLSNHLNGQVWYFKANGHCVGQLYDMTRDDVFVCVHGTNLNKMYRIKHHYKENLLIQSYTLKQDRYLNGLWSIVFNLINH